MFPNSKTKKKQAKAPQRMQRIPGEEFKSGHFLTKHTS
jgi:hypothetical protein